MTIYNGNNSTTLVLDENHCRFEKYTFQNTITNGDFIYSDNANLCCLLISCLFFKIDTNGHYVFYLNSEQKDSRIDACHSDEITGHIYVILQSVGSRNFIVCLNCDSCAPFW